MAFNFTETLTIEVPAVEEQVSAFSEGEYKRNHGLIVEVAAIHEGMTANFNFYPAKALEAALTTWVAPYPKPIIMNHDPLSEPVGRVMAAKMEEEADGTPFTKLQIAITDPEAIRKVLDQRYLTGSVGGAATEANCSVCGADWAEASRFNIPCKHQRGKAYKGKLAYMEMNGITFKEYSFVNIPADQRSNVRTVSTTAAEGEEEEGWVRSARVFSLDMNKEEIVEFSESEDRNVLAGLKKKEATPVYMNLKGAFLSALAVSESEIEEASDDDDSKKKPYGDVKYADPGYQDDNKKRYPLDTKDHIRAAWSYINQSKNASKYTSDQLKKIKGRIRSAAKKAGIELNTEEFDLNITPIEEDEDILAVSEGLSSDLAAPAEEETEEVTEGEDEEEETKVEEVPAEDNEAGAEEAEESVDKDEDPAVPEGQEKPNSADVDPETSDGAPVSRENEDDDSDEEPTTTTEEPEEVTTEEAATEELVAETDLSETVEALESRVEALESREQSLLEENARLKAALKRNLAERVVDIKIALGMAEADDRDTLLTEHTERSASSLADSLRDLAEMPKAVRGLSALPEVTEESVAVSGEENVVTEGDDEPVEDAIDPEAIFVDTLMGRRQL